MTLKYWHEEMGEKSEAKPLKNMPWFDDPKKHEALPDDADDYDIRVAIRRLFGRDHSNRNYVSEFEYTVIYPDGRERVFVATAEETTVYDAEEKRE